MPDTTPAPLSRRILAWVVPLLGLATALGVAYFAYTLAGYSWDQVVSYESPYTTMSGVDFSGPRPALSDPIPDAEARRTVLVLIDGLRDDTSRTMPTIEALRARGADVQLTVPEPSLSYPTWTTIMSGAPQQISGVTTNWYEGPVEVETLLDVASASGRRVIVSGPEDLDMMFRASEVASASTLVEWSADEYMSTTIVDNTLALDAAQPGDLIFVLLPDVDEVGHSDGGASEAYAEVAQRVDADLGRLVEGLDDGATTFIVLPDHGHIDSGGHGGWEEPVVRTFAALAGPGVTAGAQAEARLEDIAPTVTVIAGLQAPLQGVGTAIDAVLADENGSSRDAEFVRAAGVSLAYVRKVLGDRGVIGLESIGSPADLASLRANADEQRLAEERGSRLAVLLGILVAVAVLLAVIGIASWRALVAALAGTVAYAAIYNGLFFLVHRLTWSLSAFNEETMIDAFFNLRMVEAAVAALLGCLVAGLVYVALRPEPRGPHQGYLSGWLSLGLAVILVSQAVLLIQVGVFLWRWGAAISWILPDMGEAFKYDLDLIQLTALGAAAVLAPAVTWAVGRFHPRMRGTQS